MASTESWSAGSEVAAQPEPFAREAKFLSETKALGRDVRVMLEGVDKFGNLFGQVTASPPDRLPPPPPPPPFRLPLLKSRLCAAPSLRLLFVLDPLLPAGSLLNHKYCF